MRKRDLERFEKLLQEEHHKLLVSAKQAVHPGEQPSGSDGLVDDIDIASTELETSMTFRFRDREGKLLRKIEKALEKIKDGSYGECESCGEEIGTKRLLARPVAEFCISCKEQMEQEEEKTEVP